MTTYRISFQLYSARKFPPVEGQLEALAAIGYDAVEPYRGAYDGDIAGFRKRLDAVGLACPTAHMPLDALDADRNAVVGQAADARPRDGGRAAYRRRQASGGCGGLEGDRRAPDRPRRARSPRRD